MKLATSRGLSQESGRRLLLTSLTIRREHLKGVLQDRIVRRRYYHRDNNEMA